MPNVRMPRSGSMQFWPRKRAKRSYARVNAWPESKDAKLLGFAGYKAGMTHVLAIDGYKNSLTKGETVSVPVTIIECPPLKIAFARFYNKEGKVLTQILAKNVDKTLKRKIDLPKENNKTLDDVALDNVSKITAVCYTNPKSTGIGKKKPELFEVAIGGSLEDQMNYMKENLGKDVPVTDIFGDGDIADFHVVTKGKGFQGPVKRFGIALKNHKSEKGVRNPGARSGGWTSQAHMMFRVATAGQTGYHTRTEYNKKIIKIGENPEDVNQFGGIMRFGNLKNTYVLIKGSVGGERNRLVRFNLPIRPSDKLAKEVYTVEKISKTRK